MFLTSVLFLVVMATVHSGASLVQAAKRRARGYRSKAKMITIIYLIAGKFPLSQIHTI